LTLAGLLSFGHIFGPKINFIELFDLSSQAEAGGTSIMGGERSLRGFRENRFMAPMVILNNIEARIRFYDFSFWKQHFALGLNLFHDVGTVAEKISDFKISGFRNSPGFGFRVAWNQSTKMRGDWGFSSEQNQFFFGFGHIF
jgi:hemolysin activation/secretion protein